MSHASYRHRRSVFRAAGTLAFVPAAVWGQAPVAGSASSDTGTYAWGWRDFSRYNAPAMCVSAAVTAGDLAWRRAVILREGRGVLYGEVYRGPPPQEAVAIARSCGRRFTVANVQPTEFLALFHLALLEQDDSIATTALEHLVTHAPSDSTRAAALFDALKTALTTWTAQPAQFTVVDSIVTKLVALGRPGRLTLVGAYDTLMQYSGEHGDFARAVQFAERTQALLRTMTPEEVRTGTPEDAFVLAYKALLVQAWLTAPDTASATVAMLGIAARASQEIKALPPIPNPPPGWVDYADRVRDLTPATLLSQLMPGTLAPWSPLHGRVVPPVVADAWFPSRPSPGAVQLISAPIMSYAPFGVLYLDNIRRWRAQYGDKLQIVLTVDAGSNPTPADSGKWLSLAAEMERVRWYYLEHLKLPVRLAVRFTPPDSVSAFLPEPDGRRVPKCAVLPGGCERWQEEYLRHMSFADTLAALGPRLLGPDGRLVTTSRPVWWPFLPSVNWPLSDLVLRRAIGGRALQPTADGR